MQTATAWGRRSVYLTCGLVLSAGVYFYRLGKPLGSPEAYSALAASASSVGQAIRVALEYDPGKPPLYHLSLHLFAACFGISETSLRAFSGLWAMATVSLTYLLGCELFDPATAVCAAALWASNPLTFFFARWARMYTMFIALSTALFWLLLRLRRNPDSRATTAGLALVATLLLYTHLLALLFVGAATAILLRDVFTGRLATAPWIALAAALIVFAPFAPVEVAQGRELLTTHWMDYLGALSQHSLLTRGLALALSLALVTGLLMFPRRKSGNEALRFCAVWLFLPVAAMACGSILIRPMLEVRYVAPVGPAAALLLAALLAHWGSKARNLITTALVGLSVATFIPYMQITPEPWPQIAQLVSQHPGQPVIFEKGLTVVHNRRRVDSSVTAFSRGYFRAVFDYYCHSSNPRLTIDPAAPDLALQILATNVRRAGGGWLIAGRLQSAFELARRANLTATRILGDQEMVLYRIEPTTSRERNGGCAAATEPR
ncbi:MAG TPA: glycosyltransferase family 39 protein [Candidatus Binataceae bacterium]|nr:glycosyltransferase family 39 protein [Candidatus Binataceae bacterium]